MIKVRRTYQLGGEVTFRVKGPAGFAASVARTRRVMARGGDSQAVGYSVASADDARAIGAEDTASGWYVRDLDVVIRVAAYGS